MVRNCVRTALIVCALAAVAKPVVAQEGDARLVGVWRADLEKSAALVEDAALVEQMKAAAKAGLQIEMDFHADKVVLANIKTADTDTKLTGKWSVAKSGDSEMEIKIVDDKSGTVDDLKVVFLEKNLVRIKKEGDPFALVFRRPAKQGQTP
jgi:hypothetical protein